MKNLIFHGSEHFSIGAEVELQIIDPDNQHLTSRAKELIRALPTSNRSQYIKPEITQSMIEINSAVHSSAEMLLVDLLKTSSVLNKLGTQLNMHFCGGGTHPFEQWSASKIFPSSRFKSLSWQYRYLAKRFTVFALHFHLGCKNGDDAIYLTHLLSRYVPHFIALSASSPFYQGVDTGFDSSRSNVVNAFPLSGCIPYVTTWREFSAYYFKMRSMKIIRSMKDFYWDIRPKPGFGTVEVRVCDAPLTLHRAASIVAYAQALASYLLAERPVMPTEDLYLVYNYNRFQACRYGFSGKLSDPYTDKHPTIQEDILQTLEKIKPHAKALGSTAFLKQIHAWTQNKDNDASYLRKRYQQGGALEKIVRQQCRLWLGQLSKQ